LADLADYEWLTGPAAVPLFEELAQSAEPVHRQLSRLRKTLTAERARLVVGQLELRERAVTKFGDLAGKMFFSDLALQQSTDLWTARYKASRVPVAAAVADYCCGIGGDLLAFAERGPTTGWDRAPELALLATVNLAAIESQFASEVCVGQVEEQTPAPDEVWHLDPDRRTDGRRSTQIQWHSPGPELVEHWLTTSPAGILKLAPAATLPEAWSSEAELEWISRDRQCRQLVVWFGELATARGQRRATTLLSSSGQQLTTASFVGSPTSSAPLTSQVGKYVYDTDPAIRAARLTGAIAVEQGLFALQSGVSYLTSDLAVDHALLARFEVLDQLPLRVKTLSKHLQSLNIGQLEIKKRGVETDPEKLRRQLKLRGSESATLLLTRLGASEIALLARRCPA